MASTAYVAAVFAFSHEIGDSPDAGKRWWGRQSADLGLRLGRPARWGVRFGCARPPTARPLRRSWVHRRSLLRAREACAGVRPFLDNILVPRIAKVAIFETLDTSLESLIVHRTPSLWCITRSKVMPLPLVRVKEMANRLANATGPYLRQHAGNPGGLVALGGEAFAEARRPRRADPAVGGVFGLPLVPRDGARVVRGRRGRGLM